MQHDFDLSLFRFAKFVWIASMTEIYQHFVVDSIFGMKMRVRFLWCDI